MEDSTELEEMRAITLRQQSGSQLASLQRARPLDEAQIVQVGELMVNMMAGYPHQALEMAAEVYQLAFEDLARIHGIQALETALRLFLTRQKFFPHPSEVSEVLEEMAKKAKQEAAKSLPKLGCDLCLHPDATGFAGLIVKQQPGRPRIVEWCECRFARERAKKAEA